MINEIIKRFRQAERNRTFPFSEWHRKDVFERLIKDFLVSLGYNPDQFNYDDSKGSVEIEIKRDLKAIVYISSLQESERFLTNKVRAPIDTLPDPETERPKYEIAVVTNFDTWFFYFDGKEIYAFSAERLEKEYETIKQLISKEAIESGKFKEVARKLLHKEDNEPLRQELNLLREKIANKILQEKTNIHYLKNPDGSYNNEILNEITTRWITRFLSLKLAEDSGISFNFTLRDIRKSFELHGSTAKSITGAKVKEETLSNAIRTLMNEFERRYNGGIFMYEEGVDYITIPDTAFFDLLDFVTGWAFTVEDARIIGFVYERFLGQEIVIEERKGKLEAGLRNIGEARGRRKASGIYYTPKYIVDYIVENTLGEILKEKREKIDNAVKNLDCEKFLTSLKEAKSLKILDPACGSGSFLIKVLAEFKNFYEDVKIKAKELEQKIDKLKRERTKGQLLFTDDKEINELLTKYQEIKKELEEIKSPGAFALRYNIYGVDLDPKAIDITAFTLMVQVYDELKEGARCPTMINENLKVGNSLVSAITPDKRNGFIARNELDKFKGDISNLIKLREIEKSIDILSEDDLKKLIEENFDEVIDIYLFIKERYPNAIPTHVQKLLDEWHKRAKKEPIEKTYNVLIHQTGLARIFLKEVYFKKIEEIKEKIEFEINKPLIKYFNSEKRVLKDKELEEILANGEQLKEEYRFIKDRATEISKSQPPKVFNWEIEFPEVFFNEDGTLKENPGFDCVVGNPPWGRIKELEIRVEKEILSSWFSIYFSYQQGNFNFYKLFIEQCYRNLSDNGFFSMIYPRPFLSEIESVKLRKLLFENAYIQKILHFPKEAKLFGDIVLMETIILVYKKETLENYNIFLKTNIMQLEKILKDIKYLAISKIDIKNISQGKYQIPVFEDPIKEWNIFIKVSSNLPFNSIGEQYDGHLHETNDRKYMTSNPKDDILIRYMHISRYHVDLSPNWRQPRFVKKKEFLRIKPHVKEILSVSPKIVCNQFLNPGMRRKLNFAILEDNYIMSNGVRFIVMKDKSIDIRYLTGLLNSNLIEWRYRLFSHTYNVRKYEIESLPIVRATPDRQSPIISLVDAIIQKKKEYHAISQDIEDYVDFKKADLISLDEFLKKAAYDFEVLSSLKVKTDNFDSLRIKTEGDKIILEYGIKRKMEEYEEFDEDEEQVEVKGKYIIDWYEAGKGKIKDILAIEFLSKVLEGTKNFSRAKQKSIWQKIAESKVPEFNEKVKAGFSKYKNAIEKAKELDKEITKIDRAIDRLVYDLYGLTEEEIQVVEKSVWGEKFEEMYKKLPNKESALTLSKIYEEKNE